MRSPDPYWVSRLRGYVTVNGKDIDFNGIGYLQSEREWCDSNSPNSEAVGDLARNLVEMFYRPNQELPLQVKLKIIPLPGHGSKYTFEPTLADEGWPTGVI